MKATRTLSAEFVQGAELCSPEPHPTVSTECRVPMSTE